MNANRDEFLDQGFVIVRKLIPPDELETLRIAYEILVDRQREVWRREVAKGDPPGGVWEIAPQPRLNLCREPGIHDASTALAVEFWQGRVQELSSHLIAEEDAPPTEMMLMCNPVRAHGPAKWHRDFSPFLTCPTQAYADDILETGPRYVQWNIALHDDDVLWVIPGSHRRKNTAAENESMIRDIRGPVPGSLQTHLRAGDGVAYILPILHWGSNYSPRLRRTIHGGFARLTHWERTSWMDHLPPGPQKRYRRWHERSLTYINRAEEALRAAMNSDEAGYRTALDALQPGRGDKGLIKSTICLGKTAKHINNQRWRHRDSLTEAEASQIEMIHPMTLQWGPPLGERFSSDEAQQIWERFRPVDESVRTEDDNFVPGFQCEAAPYVFEDVPEVLTPASWFRSWTTGSLT
ncbi:MAG: phytanoyl-CoA dioxygenase family protein [Candidatus Latescibacterota bacterium]|nr:phytanoyl-CoA dioxygenase family protein [Candidatus Latescibacterota bacterium]